MSHLTFTDRAQEMVRAFLEQSEGELQALRIQVNGGSPVAPSFELTLVTSQDQDPDDLQVDGGGFDVFLDPRSAERLEGATVDFVERVNESGFEIKPAAVAQGVTAPTGALAERVQSVLDQQVNPAIASHGGRIDLVDVDGTEIFMEMSGGCQGCAMSRMTLRQGVEKMLKQSVPEITAIHDVTDHSAGQNPYFTA